MPVRIAKLSSDAEQPLIIMADGVVVRHAHSAVELHRLLANEFGGAIGRYLRCRDQLRRVQRLRIEWMTALASISAILISASRCCSAWNVLSG